MAKKYRNRYEDTTMEKLEERRQQRLSSSVEEKPFSVKEYGMNLLGEKFGKDTFEDDLRNVTSTLNDITSNWQTQETMENTRASVESMYKRINEYQSYQQRYGGADLSDLYKGYDKALRKWDDLSKTYAGFENADAFNVARTKAQMDQKFRGLTYDDVQAELKNYDKDSDEYKYLSNYTNYSDLRDFDKALSNAKTNVNATKDAINPMPKDNKFDVIEQAKMNDVKTANGSAITVKPEAKSDSMSDYLNELETMRNQFALDHKFDLYKGYMEAEDFEETSQYVSTKNDAFGSRLTSQYGMGYEDVTYEYVNNVDGMRDKIKSKARAFGADTGDGVSSMEKKGYDKLNEEEVAVYNSIYQKEGKEKAQQFLDDMEVTLTKRVYDEATQRWEDMADSGTGPSVLMSALSVPTKMFGSVTGTVDAVSDFAEGKEYNPYGYYKIPTNFSNDTREYVGENIAEATEGWEIFGQNIPSFLYQTGMSVADTAVGGKMFGKGYSAIMGLSATQQTAKELKEAGATSEQLAFGSVASGLVELVTEKFSIDHWLKIKGADSWKKMLKETAKQATIEGSEEFLAEVANLMADEFNRGKQSDTYKMYEEFLARGFSEKEAERMVKIELNKQIGFALAGGAISGGVLGGTSSITSYHDLSKTGGQIRENDRVSEMIDFKELTPKESEAYKLYNEYAKKGITAGNISNAQLGNLYQTSKAEARDVIESKKTTTEQKADAINRLGKLSVVNTSKSDEERAIQQRAESLNTGEVTGVTATGNSTKIESIKIEDGKTIVRTGEGEFGVDQMTFSANDAKIIAQAEAMGEKKGNLMLSQYDGKVNADNFAKSFDLAYSYGEIGMGLDSVLKNKGVLTETQASEIYKTAMTNKSQERQQIIDEINENHSSAVFVQGKFDDSIIDYDGTSTDGSKVAWKDLTPTQRSAIKFAKAFAKVTGANITFIQSEVVDGKRKGKNGSYNSATNTIEIDVYAGIDNVGAIKDSIIPTLSHEMTHWMEAKSPAMYAKIREYALETLAMKGGVTSEERIAYEKARLLKNHEELKSLSDTELETMAVNEIVARACEDMLSNSNTARKLLNQMSKKEQQSFIAKVKDTFNNLMEWVNELLSQYKSSSKEAEILREYKNRLKEVSKMWDKALEEAIKSNQSLQAEGITGEQLIGENVITENTAQFSIRTYENEGRDLLHKWLENSDLSKKDKKNIIEQMDYVYDVATKYAQENDLVDFASWSDTDIIRRDDGTPILTVVVPNGEYPLNIDFSQICKKRKALNTVLNALVRSGDLDIRTLSQSDIGNINRIIKEHGFEIACALCFVDSKRYRVNEWADSFADTFNKLVKSLTKGTDYKVDEYNYTGRNVKQPEGKLLKDADDSELNFDYINEVLAKNSSGKAIYRYALAIKNNKELRSVLNSSEIISSAGLDAIKVQNELLYGLVNSHQGSAKPKLSHSENPYGYEILLDARFNAEDAYKVGGVRIQSFSDYMANMFFDYVQMIGDLSAKKLPAHAYTKEYYFAKLFGLTGIKINMSIVPKGADITDEQKARFNKMTKAMKEKDAEFKALKSHAGLDANGNYILEDETFPLDKALEIQNTKGYDKNCGIIWVGVSNAHINKMLDDENVPFIIPYHKSSLNPAIARMRNIDFYNDYTKAQNTRYDSKAKKKVPASVWSFDFYADLAKTNDPRQTAENYKTECQNRGYLPKFDEFANHPNYYKLLVDFRVYDANGNYAPQSAVKMEFPSDFNEIVGESLVEAQETQIKLDADMKGLLDEIRSELKLGQEQYLDRDIDSQLSEISSEMQNLQSEMFELEKNEEFQNAKTNLAFAESFKEKVEARKALKEIKDRLGYNDLVERNAELDSKRIELIKQKESQKEPFRVRTLEDSDYARLKKHFGTTSNFTVAGYMLKDGSMLDFSGKHWGDSSSTMRTVDHRDVKEVFEDTNNSGTEEMMNMISNGNIRLMAETGGINLSVAPTSDQLRVLEKYINNFRGEVVVDIDKVGGDTIKSFTYDRGTSAKKVLDDIDNYFRGGRQSELMMFHTLYSDRTSDNSSIKEQLLGSTNILNGMTPVATVSEEFAFSNKQDAKKWVLEKYEEFGFEVERSGFGTIILDKKRVSKGMSYLKTNEEILAFSVVPQVLKEGVIISTHSDHKGRSYRTVTFGGPVVINNQRGNVAVVVRQEGENYYKVHRILATDGTTFELNKNRDISETMGGVENNSSLSPTDDISMDSIAQEKGFSQYSDRDSDGNQLTEAQQEFFKDSKVRDTDGNLMVMYHGTDAYEEFTVFKKGKSGYLGSGIYFSSDRRYADRYAKSRGYEGRVYATYVDIKNPLVVTSANPAVEILGEKVAQRREQKNSFPTTWVTNADIKKLQEKGYDGILWKFGGSVEVSVWNANQIKLTTNTNPTNDADIRFSDRDNVSVYDAMGETERLIDENARLKADIETLKANISDDEVGIKKFRSLAVYLKKLAGSQYNRETLGDELKEVYTYIQTTDDLQWNNVFAKTYDVARRMMNLNPNVSTNYFKEVMSNVRKDKVTLSEDQRAEAEKLFGNYGDFHRAMFGRVNVVTEGTPLSEMWKEWSKKYPAIFDANLGAEKQVEALVDIVNALKASSSMMGEYEQEEAIRHLATEIYNQFWNIASDKSDAVQKSKANHRKMMEDLRKEYEQRQKEKTLHPVGETALKYEKLLRQTMQRDKAEVKKARELGKKRLDDYKDRAERNAKIQTITKKAMTLNQWLTKNSRDEHIPEVMKAPVAYLLNAIDFSSKQLLGMRGGSNAGMPTKKDLSFSKALEQVHDMVQKINSAQIGENEITEIYGSFADFPAGFADDIRELSSSVNDVMRTVGDNAYVLNEMSLEQLETLDKIITIIKSTVTKMNKFLAIRHAEGVANLSQQSIVEMDQLGKIKTHEGWRGKIDKLVDWGNALPYHTFKRFGTGGQKVYEALQDGWDKFAFHVKAIIDYAESVYTSDEVKEWSKDIKTFDVLEPATEEAKASKDYKPKYQKVQMTVPQIMSLYCLQKREQAKGHLMGGGMRVSDIKVKNNVISQTDGVILSQSEIDTIVNSLTGRQKKVADALQKFMNTVCTDWGNEVSMLRFGFNGFGEDNYFPIQSDKNNLAVNDETEQNNSLFRLLNMSFTKGTIQKANNRIVISDIFDVFAQHTSDMAKYNALALPVLDSFKWYNYKEKAQKGETQFVTKSLKQSMENAFGKDAQNYFTTFLRDINGEHSAGRDSVGGGFFTNAKIASVGFNMRVVALQPTSYLRASAVIDTKYLAKALAHKPKTSMAEKHCGIALWKSLGFYDINVQNGVADMIKHEETLKDRVVEASMKGAEVADKVTWGYLWNACELEVRDKRKDLKVGSENFYKAVGDRLREVIYSTQVVDSTMTRSHMMRSADNKDKMVTAFMSEPTISYNMLQDVYYDWKLTERRTGSKQTAFAQNGKKMARVITAYTVTNMMCALVEAGFDVFRDDEDEMTAEEFMELYLKNFGSDMSILGKIPVAKEIVSMLQGYSSSRLDTQWMQYLTNTFKGVVKLTEGKGNAYTTAKNFMRTFSQATGLPFYNAYRDFMALLDEADILTADEMEEIFNDTIGSIFPSLKSK